MPLHPAQPLTAAAGACHLSAGGKWQGFFGVIWQVDAFIDTFGADYVRLAPELGVEPSRVGTIVSSGAVTRYEVKAEGRAAGASASVLAELAELIAPGQLEVQVAATFPHGPLKSACTAWPQKRRVIAASARSGGRPHCGWP